MIFTKRNKARKCWDRLYRSGFYCLCFLLLAGAWVVAQEEMERIQPRPENPGEDLVKRIVENMKKIDDNLLNASSGGVAEGLEENISNIEKLLEETRKSSNQVVQDLDELIRSIKYQRSQSSQGGTPPPPQESSQDKQNQPRQEEKPQDLQENPAADPEENQEDKQPKDGQPKEDPATQEPGNQPPPAGDPEKTAHPDLSGRWGVLPPKIQNDILNFNLDKFPQKYRKWLEAYYKRINRRER